MTDAAHVLEQALSLAADERARIAHELIRGLAADDTEAGSAWSDEIRRRVDEIEADTAELEDWEAVRARLEAAGGEVTFRGGPCCRTVSTHPKSLRRLTIIAS